MITKAQAFMYSLVLTVFSFSCTSSYSVRLTVHPSSLNGKGRIVGFVSDKQTSEMLIGANVILEGTSIGAATDVNGYYRIDGVPPGRHNVHVSYIGYDAVRHFELMVEPDKLMRLDFELVESIIQIYEEQIRR